MPKRMRVCNDTCPVAPSYNILSSSDFFEPDRDGQILTRRPELAKVLQLDSKSNGGISNLTVTKTSDHTLVITPNSIGSHPPYPSKDDGGHNPIRVHVHSVRPGSPGDVTVGGADPVHPSPS